MHAAMPIACERRRVGQQTYLPNIEERTAMYIGRFLSGTAYPTMVKPPEKIPAAPRPATARPTIKAGEFGADPQIVEPTTKRLNPKAYPWT